MQKSPSPHSQFFTSLKHLEKRLKLENHPAGPSTLPPPQPPPPPPPSLLIQPQETINNTQETDSLGTPMYLDYNQSATSNSNTSNLQESEAPAEFLSRSPDFPPTHHIFPSEVQERGDQRENFNLDYDVELLMQLLHLSDCEELDERVRVNDLGCDDGFYDKIVGAKGPKSVKEVERLEGWIKHFLNGEKKEPLRLAHLLLGKAAFMHSDDDCDGFGGVVFPSTIDEFLQNDPPID